MTKKTTLTLGYSTCPNDTFIFHAIAHDLIGCKKLNFKIELGDVEKLNQNAKKGLLDISKLSCAATGHLLKTYGLLRSGAALGRGCGPLIVARPGFNIKKMRNKQIAVPGHGTTACMLLRLFLPFQTEVVPLTFDQIMPRVQNGAFDFGLIIHEGRFTYKEYGLECLVDLGEWWESETSLPIPLGGIAIRRNLDKKIISEVETAIRKSVIHALNNRTASEEYVKKYAQEMDTSVIQSHIELYVNEFTIDIGQKGENAINRLFSMARGKGLLPQTAMPIFAT